MLCVSLVSSNIYIYFFWFLRAGNFLSVKLILLGDFICEAEMQGSIFPLFQLLGHWLIKFEKGHQLYFVLLLFYTLSWP